MRRRDSSLPAVALVALVALSMAALAPAAAGAERRRGGRARHADVERAVAQFRQALAVDPTDAAAATSLGVALGRLGRRDEAEAALRQAIQYAPTRPAAYAHLADLLSSDPRGRERRDEVLAMLKIGLKLAASDPTGRTDLALSAANFERSVGRTGAAKKRLEEVGDAITPEQRRRRLELGRAIEAEVRARGLLDWPEPAVPEEARRALRRAAASLETGALQSAIDDATRLAAAYPGWRAPLWLRARSLEASGQLELAERELTVLVQLAPSHADAWCRLSRLLAVHGGTAEAQRADDALRQALALAPGQFDLWLLRAQLAVRRGHLDVAQRALARYLQEAPGRAGDAAVQRLQQALAVPRAAPRRATAPRAPVSAEAQRLLGEAQHWLGGGGDVMELAPDLLDKALADSPGFVEAAVTRYTLTGFVSPATVEALWDDGPALLDLAQQVLTFGRGAEARALTRPWLDRAVELAVPEARFHRGALRLDEGDRQGGVADLLRYVSSASRPPALDEARGLLAGTQTGAQDPQVLARVLLMDDEPVQAAQALGGRCERTTAAARLFGIGRVHEWAGDLAAAIGCYREVLRRSPGDGAALAALSSVATRAPLGLVTSLEPELRRGVAAGRTGAPWALGRLLLARGDVDGAMTLIERFLGAAPRDDPARPEALAAQEKIRGARALRQRDRDRRRLAIAGGGGGVVLLALIWFFWGRPLGRALRRRPALYPVVARAIAELRHDVLKHRTSVIGVVAGGNGAVEEVAEVLWEPERPSVLVAAAYAELRRAAAARGVTLRRLGREPVFGPLVRDLRRAESIVGPPGRSRGPLPPASARALQRVDARLRELHPDRLGALLRLGPRTRLDPVLVSGWVRSVEAELRVRDEGWISPVLQLHGLDLEFPVEQTALATIFANLLRNAQAAAAAAETTPRGVLVRVKEERDATGRRQLMLLVGDSAPGGLTVESIEGRESGRGLAIVRDLVHEWRGHLLVRPEAAPFAKGVGACFPA